MFVVAPGVGVAVTIDYRQGSVNELVFNVSIPLRDGSVDMRPSTDNDSDGLFSDEVVKNHRSIIWYFDENQRVPDIAWSWVQMGRVARFGYTLDYSETMTVAASLKALSPSLQKDGELTLEIRPEGGTMIRVERTIPAAIDPLMNLR